MIVEGDWKLIACSSFEGLKGHLSDNRHRDKNLVPGEFVFIFSEDICQIVHSGRYTVLLSCEINYR